MAKILYVTTLDMTIWSFLIPHLKALREEGFEAEVACRGGKFIKDIEKEGFRVHLIPFSRKFYHYSNIKGFFRLLKILKDNRYTFVHTHTPVASFISRIAAKIAKVPIIYTVHGFHFHEHGNKFSNFFYLNLEKFAGTFTNVIITINSDDYRIAKENFSNNSIFYLKGVGVNTEKINPSRVKDNRSLKQELGIKDNEKVIGTVAEMNPGKRYEDLIYAAAYLIKNNQKLKVLCIGEGRLINYYKSLVEKLGIKEKCIFTGYRKDVVDLLGIMDIFIFASIREGLPVALMEAMSMEKPVVATNIRGNRDLILDRVNGRLVPVRKPEAIAKIVFDFLSNEEAAKEIGKAGRIRIEREFSEKVIVSRLLKIYEIVLEKGNLGFNRE